MGFIERLDTEFDRNWLLNQRPGLHAVQTRLKQMRRIRKDAALVEAWLVGYGMELMGLDNDFDEVPEELQDQSEFDDD